MKTAKALTWSRAMKCAPEEDLIPSCVQFSRRNRELRVVVVQLDIRTAAAVIFPSDRLAVLRLELLAVEFRAPDVDVGVLQQPGSFLRLQLAYDPAGRADDEDAVGIFLAFRDERAGGYEAAAADDCVVQDDRADAYERSVADRAAVQHRLVADRDVFAEGERDARVGVQDRGVLDVGALGDGDDVAVAAYDRVEPDARLVVQNDRADDGGVVRDEPLLAMEHDFALAE